MKLNFIYLMPSTTVIQKLGRLRHCLAGGHQQENQRSISQGWKRLVFPAMSLLALVWFLCRVIPKPVRATYPCQRAAFPLASAFVIWVLGFNTSFLSWLGIQKHYQRLRTALLVVCGVFVTGLMFAVGEAAKTAHWVSTDGPNSPMGVARGVHPGRVAWDFDPAAVSWNFKGNWWDDAYNQQTNIDQMLSKTIRCVGGGNTDAAAWDAIFHSFNRRLGRADTGYAAGQKVAVKINMNNTDSHTNNNNINASPHMVLALLRQLVNQAGVAPASITIFDASRFVTDNIFNKCHKEFPDVVFVDNIGVDGRVKSTYKTNAIPYSVDNDTAHGLATCATEADYLINLALLKGHGGEGVTLCAKNYYGVTSINSDWHKNGHKAFSQPRDGSAAYMTFVDFMGHKDLGEKTLLFIIDGLYGCQGVGGSPQPKWQTAPFNNQWPSSVFVSQDGVAIDSVALDFFRTEFPTGKDIAYADTYLHEAANANAPASGTFYDPDRTGIRLPSLGTHEHWNNATNKQYCRNLSPNGTGIELVAVHSETRK